MLQGDNQKLIADNEFSMAESLLRGKALNLIGIRGIFAISITASVVTSLAWALEQVGPMYGDPIAGEETEFEQKGNNAFFIQLLAYIVAGLCLLEVIGLVRFFLIARYELSKQGEGHLDLDPETPKDLRVNVYLFVFTCETLSIAA